MEPRELEQFIDRELKALPPPAAPGSLRARVMAAVAMLDHRPWYSRAWLTWPRELQLVSVALFALLLVGSWSLAPGATGWLVDVAAPATGQAFGRVAAAVNAAERLATLGRVLWQVILQPIALYFAVLAVFATLGSAALWAAVNRLALGGASRS